LRLREKITEQLKESLLRAVVWWFTPLQTKDPINLDLVPMLSMYFELGVEMAVGVCDHLCNSKNICYLIVIIITYILHQDEDFGRCTQMHTISSDKIEKRSGREVSDIFVAEISKNSLCFDSFILLHWIR